MTPLLPDEARSFVAKWLANEPEMEVALGFVPVAQRDLARCWGALQHELLEGAFAPRDAGVAQVKLAWWGETLVRAAAGTQSGNHPLVRALFAHPAAHAVDAAAWQTLMQTVLGLATQETTPADVAALLASRRAHAAAVLAVERTLFPCAAWRVVPESTPASVEAVAAGTVLRQLRAAMRGTTARSPFVPLQLFARHGLRAAEFDPRAPLAAPLLADLATALAAAFDTAVPAVRLRRCRIAFDRSIAQAFARRPAPAAAMVPRWSALWLAWRAARA